MRLRRRYGDLIGDSAASLQAIRRSPIGEAAAVPRGPYGQTRANLITALAQTSLPAARGRLTPAAFDTKPLPPYNAPLVRANSASAIILLWAFCPHRTHSARRLFRRALMRLALFSVSNGVLGVFCLVAPAGPAARACACATEDRMRTIHLHI